MQTRCANPASAETPQELAERLGLPCEVVQTPHGCVIQVGRFTQAQIDATHRHMLRMARERQ